jgi:hypothetical protein
MSIFLIVEQLYSAIWAGIKARVIRAATIENGREGR